MIRSVFASKLLRQDSAAYAVADQLAMVGGNFLLSVYLARTASLAEFGVFSILYAIVVLANTLHGPIIAEPLTLSRREQGGAPSAPHGLRITLGIFIPLAFVAALVVPMGVPGTGPLEALALVVACVSSVAYWTQKSWLHALALHRHAFFSSTAASLAMLAAAVLLHDLNPVLTGLASISLGAVVGTIVASHAGHATHCQQLTMASILAHGKVGLPSALLIWVANNGVFAVLAVMHRVEDAAGLRAVLTLLLPLNQVMIGMSLFLLPHMVALSKQGLDRDALRLASRCGIYGVAAALAFGIATRVLSADLIRLVLGEKFLPFTDWLQMAALALPVAWVVTTVARTYLRGSLRSQEVLRGYAIAFAFGGPLAVVLLFNASASSAMHSFMSIHATIAASFLAVLVIRIKRDRHGG